MSPSKKQQYDEFIAKSKVLTYKIYKEVEHMDFKKFLAYVKKKYPNI